MTNDPQESTDGQLNTEEKKKTRKIGPAFTSMGDRLLINGDPGPVEQMVQKRSRQARVAAEERALTVLERANPDIMELLSPQQVDTLVNTLRSVVQQAAEERDQYVLEVLKGTLAFIPGVHCFPDPRHPDSAGVKEMVGDGSGLTDALEVEPGE